MSAVDEAAQQLREAEAAYGSDPELFGSAFMEVAMTRLIQAAREEGWTEGYQTGLMCTRPHTNPYGGGRDA